MIEPQQFKNEKIQDRLLLAGGLFVALYAAALTISPAVLKRSDAGPFRWDHWLGVAVWVIIFYLANRRSRTLLPERDPFLLPAAALLCGWGMLTVWSMLPVFGMRQALWLVLTGLVLIAGFRLHPDLKFLRRYKYVWLTGSLLLTVLTLLWGVNPLGYGPRMWLGCCGIYFQPSEPMKLMLIAYLAAYIADRQALLAIAQNLGSGNRGGAAGGENMSKADSLMPLLAPTLLMAGLAVAVLAVQRDLGTAAILFFLYAAIIYVTTRRKIVLLIAALGLLAAGGIGYMVYDVIRVRVDAWLNPWADPSGRAYQIVQALLAVANGGLVGRGPGLGSPELVPVAHSDLIFAAVSEQMGLAGALGMLALAALAAGRGLQISLRSQDPYRRTLAAGLTAYLAGQSLLIIGGTLRIFPLTGITLPFVSYGGSSLLVSMIALLLLLVISQPGEAVPTELPAPQPYLHLGLALGTGAALCALAAGWWAVARSPALLARTDNPRRSVSDRFVRRGAILDRDEEAISTSSGPQGELKRKILTPALSSVVGYTSPTYGQSGLESSLDGYLRGLQGNRFSQIFWDQLVYGQPPAGLDIRLAIDLDLQLAADRLLQGEAGALVLINAHSGDILAMASHPTFDANRLSEEWSQLINDPRAPLLNRATLGRYPVGELDDLFPEGISGLGVSPTPDTYLPTGDLPSVSAAATGESYSPLQMVLAASAVTGGGIRPAPRFASAVNLPLSGWTILPMLDQAEQVLTASAANQIAEYHRPLEREIWQVLAVVPRTDGTRITWYLGGALPGQPGLPYALGLVMESDSPELAEQIGQAMLIP
jgi:cell division protein FtsW (lipid II flippase)